MTLGDRILLITGVTMIAFSVITAKDTKEFWGRVYFGIIILLWVCIIGFHFNGLLEAL